MAPDAPQWLVRKVFGLLRGTKMQTREDRVKLMGWIVCRDDVTSTDDLNIHELETISHTLGYWQRMGELESRARSVVDTGNI